VRGEGVLVSHNAEFANFTVLSVKLVIFCNETPYNFYSYLPKFRTNLLPPSSGLKMEVVSTSETSPKRHDVISQKKITFSILSIWWSCSDRKRESDNEI